MADEKGQWQGPDRRRDRRLTLRLPMKLLTSSGSEKDIDGLLTSNISTRGMHFCIPSESGPPAEEMIDFELLVPPGDGYSPNSGRIRGSGKVVRTTGMDSDTLGVAVQFVSPLNLEF
jgi:hypothetical protein